MNLGFAIEQLLEGNKVSREGWNAHHHLELQVPDENSKMTRPYIYMVIGGDAKDLKGDKIPWVASQTDLLATDWEVV